MHFFGSLPPVLVSQSPLQSMLNASLTELLTEEDQQLLDEFFVRETSAKELELKKKIKSMEKESWRHRDASSQSTSPPLKREEGLCLRFKMAGILPGNSSRWCRWCRGLFFQSLSRVRGTVRHWMKPDHPHYRRPEKRRKRHSRSVLVSLNK